MQGLVRDPRGRLCIEEMPLADVAQRYGTPCYVYSKAALTRAYQSFRNAFQARDTLICYAVKANSNLAILNLLARLGAGFDIVSGGELARVLEAGGDPRKVVFSGVGKSAAEMRLALEKHILCFNVESEQELDRLAAIAQTLSVTASISLRVNPDVDANTHPYISTGLRENKFGVPFPTAFALYRKARALAGIRIAGIDCHIGSQITTLTPFADALEKILALVDQLAADGIALSHIDLGGGTGIRYRDEEPLLPGDYARTLLERLAGYPQRLILEPGRALVGNTGLLLARVEYLKHGAERNFAVVDAAMNDLIRPALYDAYHEIVAVTAHPADDAVYDVVGPVCESADFLGRGRKLSLEEGDLLAVLSAGAYGSVMASNYNSRPRAAEIIVDGSTAHLVRERESVPQLYALEHLLP
jgi:diaminopimelate decarboxylase